MPVSEATQNFVATTNMTAARQNMQQKPQSGNSCNGFILTRGGVCVGTAVCKAEVERVGIVVVAGGRAKGSDIKGIEVRGLGAVLEDEDEDDAEPLDNARPARGPTFRRYPKSPRTNSTTKTTTRKATMKPTILPRRVCHQGSFLPTDPSGDGDDS